MTIRNLSYLFEPTSVALIGASQRPGSLGNLIAANLSSAGFKGELFAVNPKYDQVGELNCYPDVKNLPQAVDLAVIATPPRTIPKLIKELADNGSRAAVVISAGFAESGEARGKKLQQAMLDAAKPYNFRILGPNCLGVLVPGIGLNASFAHLPPQTGHIAVLSQSGAILTTMIDWASEQAIGFSHLVSLGAMADVDFGDTLNYFAEDQQTHAILLYIESITEARKFISAARAAARLKPVIVLKSGRSAAGAKAAASHTGTLAGQDDVYHAVFERAGISRVYSIPELFDMVTTLAQPHLPKNDRLAVVTNGGGIGVLAADALVDEGGQLAELSPTTLKQLDKVLPKTWSHANPIDIIGDAPPQRYADTLQVLQQDPGVDAILALHCPVATASSTEAAQAVIDNAKPKQLPLLTSWVGGQSVAAGRDLFARQHIPSYESPAEAVHAFMQMVRYWRNQEMLMETPPSVADQFSCDCDAVSQIIDQALAQKRVWLNDREVQAVLNAYQIPTVSSHFATDAEQAAKLAEEIDGPLALKIVSPDITHKSDVGGVALDLKGSQQVRLVAMGMLATLQQKMPKAKIEGFTLQPMIHWPQAFELILGVFSDPLFGPVILFGHGGTAVEVINDKALALPPLNLKLARDLIAQTRVAKLLNGYRDQPAADQDAIALTLLKLAQLISDQNHIVELDINPLLASERGVLSLDARIRISPEVVSGPERMVIRPYPRELEETITLNDGRQMLLRPIRAEDEPALIRGFQRLSAEEIRLRFHHPMRMMVHKLAARLTQIDYDREMALILVDKEKANIHGVVRLNADPDRQSAEFAIIVGRWMTGMGVGTLLMQRIIGYAKEQGIAQLIGLILDENQRMLDLSRRLGFTLESDPSEPGVMIASLNLNNTH